MSEEAEPSIEEILTSIRQIISDDEEEVAPEPEPEAAAEPAPEPEPEPEVEEILDLTDAVEDSPPQLYMEDAPLPEPEPELAPIPDVDQNPIISQPTESAAVEGFARLAKYIPVDRRNNATLEDLVRDMLKPMLKLWLDENLPSMVEDLVREELERIARQAMDD